MAPLELRNIVFVWICKIDLSHFLRVSSIYILDIANIPDVRSYYRKECAVIFYEMLGYDIWYLIIVNQIMHMFVYFKDGEISKRDFPVKFQYLNRKKIRFMYTTNK